MRILRNVRVLPGANFATVQYVTPPSEKQTEKTEYKASNV